MEMMDEVVNLDTSSAEAAKSHQETTDDYAHIFAVSSIEIDAADPFLIISVVNSIFTPLDTTVSSRSKPILHHRDGPCSALYDWRVDLDLVSPPFS